MHFNDRLKELRSENGLTQHELAVKLGITRSSYSLYELGLREPNLAMLIELSKFFNVTLDYLAGLTDSY